MAQDLMKKHHLFCTEAANTITHIENITIRKGNTQTPYYLFYGRDAPYTKYLQVFGQVGIVKVLQPTNKLSDKGLKQYLWDMWINMQEMCIDS